MPFEPRLSVHAVLDAGAVEQIVMVEWVYGTGLTGADNATVILRLPDGREITGLGDAQDPNKVGVRWSGRYRIRTSDQGPMQFGEQYQLRVTVGTVSAVGVTTLPEGPARPDSLAQRTISRSRDTLRLAWPRVPGAASYYVVVRRLACCVATSHDGTGSGTTYASYYATFADTSVAIPGNARNFEDGNDAFVTGEASTVVVSAVDSNFYDYFHSTADPFATRPSKMQGGMGVFGSLVPVLVQRVNVVP